MLLTSWGNYPKIEAHVSSVLTKDDVTRYLLKPYSCIARGLGRSYGDSALSHHVLSLGAMDHFISFDDEKGVLVCEAGTSLADILDLFVPKGWFLPVTPGTKFVTLGGAIASDVHGKNHHISGCFSEFVLSFELMLADGSVIKCSRNEHANLFYASCGGMGLTGIILSASIQLKKIESAWINERIIRANNLSEVFTLFEEHHDSTYSVAWIDCLATGQSLGRSLLMLGEHAKEGGLLLNKHKKITVPVSMPSFLLNHYSIRAFNSLYFHKQRNKTVDHIVHYDKFFYPLDNLNHWNRLYGKHGFLQYQYILPKEVSLPGMTDILKKITASRRGSFLSVLKACGPKNKNHLSFPIQGYSLALDFKMETGIFDLLDELDRIVAHYGGRVYLTKDARLSEKMFKQTYSDWENFSHIREKYGAHKKFHSHQSQRLGI